MMRSLSRQGFHRRRSVGSGKVENPSPASPPANSLSIAACDMSLLERPGLALGRFVIAACQTTGPCMVSSPFELPHEPPIALMEFADRLDAFFGCEPGAYLHAAAYIGRLQDRWSDFCRPRSAHKLMLAALVIAVKYWDDDPFRQEHYAQCGGILAKELSCLEATMLELLDYKLYVCDVEVAIAFNMMVGHSTALHQAHLTSPRNSEPSKHVVRGSM